jgi:predicted acylesterase/phospholipase RssA
VITPVVEDGRLLVDGAILNNVPADVMRAHGAGVVIVVDVSVEAEMQVSCAEFPSPWGTVWSRLLRRPVPRLPNIMEVILRTTLLASTSRARLTRQQADYYLEPPLGEYGLMDFESLEKVAEIGYRETLERIAAWGGPEAMLATPGEEGGTGG